MATSNGPTQATGRIEWVYSVGGVSQSTKSVTVNVTAYFRQLAPNYQQYNGTKSWSGAWGANSAAQGYFLAAGARVQIVTGGINVTLTDAQQTRTFVVTARHFFGTTGSTLTVKIPARYALTPTQLLVTRNSDTSHRLNWSRASTYASVVVQRRVNGGSWAQVARPSGNAYTWTDTTTKAGNQYEYRVAGVAGSGQSGWSNTARVYTSPVAPTGVTATRSGTGIRVDASGRPRYATTFNVRDGGVSVATGVTLPWTHAAPDPAVPHSYTLQGVTGGLAGAWSSVSNVVQLLSAPLAPTSLKPNGEQTVSDLITQLAWKHAPVDSSEQSAAEVRYRAVGASAWITVTATTVEYVGRFLVAGSYEWQVRTKGSHPDWSPWSALAAWPVIDRPGVAVTQPEGAWDRRALTVAWSWEQAQGRPQSAWEVELSGPDGVVEHKSGTGAAKSVAMSARVDHGVTYSVTVRAAAGNVWSELAAQEFTVSVPAAAPALVEGSWSEESGTVSLSVTEGRGPEIQPVTNLFPNPRATGDGATVELYRNLVKFSTLSDSSAGWTVNGTNFTHSAVPGGRKFIAKNEVSTTVSLLSTATAHIIPFPASTDFVYTARVENGGSLPVPLTLSVYLRREDGSNPGTISGDIITLSPGEARTLVTAGTSTSDSVDIRGSIRTGGTIGTFPEGGEVTVSDGITLLGGTRKSIGLISGEMGSPEPDLTARWVGIPFASETVLEGEIVRRSTRGGGAWIVTSVSEGRPSARVATAKATTSATSMYPVGLSGAMGKLGLVPGGTYTVVGTIELRESQTGALDVSARRISVGVALDGAAPEYPWSLSEAAPNEPGIYPLSVTFTIPANATECFVRFMNGSQYEDVWWSEMGITRTALPVPAFHGATGLVQVGESWLATSWDGEIDDSPSTARMAPVAVRTEIERSIDGGLTWSLMPEGMTTDPESLSNGTTLYRVSTFSADDAASSVVYEVVADSPAVWLSGGDGFELSARLPYDPEVDFTAGRARTLKQYSGRSRPVVYAGEAVTRTVQWGGTVLADDSDVAGVRTLEDIAQADAPLHLYRDPDGRFVKGMLSPIGMSRVADGVWAYTASLEESDN